MGAVRRHCRGQLEWAPQSRAGAAVKKNYESDRHFVLDVSRDDYTLQMPKDCEELEHLYAPSAARIQSRANA